MINSTVLFTLQVGLHVACNTLVQTIFYSLITNICVEYQCKVPLQSINVVYKQKGQIQSTLQTLQGPDIFKYSISIQNHFVLESTTNSSLCVSYQQLGLNQRSLTLLQDVDCNNHTCTFQHTFRSRTSFYTLARCSNVQTKQTK